MLSRWHADTARVTRILAVFGVALAMCLVAVGGRSPRVEAAATVLSPEAAVARFVEEAGNAYAGPCEQTRSPHDIGKICARFIEEQDATTAYLVGRTFSEFDTWVFVTRAGDGWTLAGTEPLDAESMTATIPWPR